VRALGVSNFGVAQLEAMAAAGLPKPQVNQIYQHLWHQQPELVAYCRARGIVVTAFSPLKPLLADGRGAATPVLAAAAKAHGKTVAQVALRWAVQSGVVTIPKSVGEARILENSELYGRPRRGPCCHLLPPCSHFIWRIPMRERQ
jgi:2,5-diketo-D-gluconate reductase A